MPGVNEPDCLRRNESQARGSSDVSPYLDVEEGQMSTADVTNTAEGFLERLIGPSACDHDHIDPKFLCRQGHLPSFALDVFDVHVNRCEFSRACPSWSPGKGSLESDAVIAVLGTLASIFYACVKGDRQKCSRGHGR